MKRWLWLVRREHARWLWHRRRITFGEFADRLSGAPASVPRDTRAVWARWLP